MEPATRELKRRGNVEKCPVCGSPVDAEAYCCPTCTSLFCFHCRARVLASDPQFQCVNQSCDYYGRLICDVCDSRHEREESPSVYLEPEDGFWPLLLVLALISGAVGWIGWRLNLLGVILTMAAVFGLGSMLVRLTARSVFGRNVRIEQRRLTPYHTCISCGGEVRRLVKDT
jgi:hypothetical protein